MDTIIPSPDTIPVHWFWFQALLVITFVLHLILMNLMLGGSLLVTWDNVIKRRKPVGQNNLPILVALTINLGVPPLLFVQVLYGHLFYSSSIIMAVPWILVIPILILAYYGSYVYCKNIDRAPAWSRAGIIVSSLFLLYVGFMMVNNATLSVNPSNWGVQLERPGGLNLNLSEPSLWPRYLHFVFAALAVASLGLAIYSKHTVSDEEEKNKISSHNLKRFAWFSIIQSGIGIWFLLANPKEVWMTYMGGSTIATILFVLGIIIAVSMIVFAFRARLNATLYHLVTIIVIMVIMREYMRAAGLNNVFSPASLETSGKISSFIVFLVVFLAGIYFLYYMYRLATNKNIKS
ncbi:MAG: hypothetical protein K9J25_08935 [Bacteroidales bacterium]|nr:hypothetical protein [Bacteroidales bacterium]